MVSTLVLVVLLLGGDYGARASEDLSKYWEKDFMEVGHLYGKTSDKDLYGANLPPAVTYNAATTGRNDIILEHTGNYEASDIDPAGSTYPRYKYKHQTHHKESLKPAQSVNYLSYSESNSVKQNTEQTNKHSNQPQRTQENIDSSSKINLQGFKPYLGNKETDHTNIQNIVSTERNEVGAGEVIADENRTYRNKARNKATRYRGNALNVRTKCPSRICAKKSRTSKRVYSRPLKKIKRIVVY